MDVCDTMSGPPVVGKIVVNLNSVPPFTSFDMLPWTQDNWPEWRHRFQIALANIHSIEDSRKIIFLLDCLDFTPKGLAIVYRLFPQLANYRAAPVLSVTFAQVWWQFHEYCWMKYNLKTDPLTDLSDDRKRLQQICDEEKEKGEYQTLFKLIPILSLCELEFVRQRVPSLDRIVQNFTQLFGVRIEPCCLKNHPIEVYEDMYMNYGCFLPSLTLIGLPEPDAVEVLPFFPHLEQFCMQNMTIVEDGRGLPQALTELTLIDCKIDLDPMDTWTETFETTLRRLHVDNFQRFFVFDKVPSREVLKMKEFPYLKAVTCKSKLLHLTFLNAPKLERFYYDVLPADDFMVDLPKPDLKYLIVKDWESFSCVDLFDFPSLEEVEIISPVDPKHKERIESEEVKVLAEYIYIPADPPAPEEPNLIFNMLNYDCLLEIVNYLSKHEWMLFGRLHENAEMVVASYKYPRVEISTIDFLKTGIYPDDQEHFLRVSALVQNLIIDMDTRGDLNCPDWKHFIGAFEPHPRTTLTLERPNLSSDLFDILPWKLDKLVMCYSRSFDPIPSTSAYMRRLNVTIRSLEIFDYMESEKRNWQWLTELEGLEEISIKVPLPPHISKVLLERSVNSLERLRMIFSIDEGGWTDHESALKVMSTLKNLKQLEIVGKRVKRNDELVVARDIHLLTNVLKSVGRNLDTLKLFQDFDFPDLDQLLHNGSLRNLSHLILESGTEWLFNFVGLEHSLLDLDGLRTLEIIQDEEDYGGLISDNEMQRAFLIFIESKPSLEELRCSYLESSFKFEMELRKYLKQKNRRLLINSVQY